MTLNCMLDRHQRSSKPTRWQTVQMQGYMDSKTKTYQQPTLVQDEIEIEDLAFGLCSGMTCKPALLNGSKSKDWVSQSVFMLDFDWHEEYPECLSNTTIDAELANCRDFGIMPAFIYTTFSHEEDKPRFRFVFVTNEIITDIDKRNMLQATLITIFEKSDSVTFDPTRIFYGGGMGYPVFLDTNSLINADMIIEKYFDEDCENVLEKLKNANEKKSSKPKNAKEKKEKKISRTKKVTNENYMENVKAIMSLDIEALRNLIGIGDEAVVLKTEQDVYDFFDEIDMCEVINLSEDVHIKCILPDHPDNDASAHIHTLPDGNQVYKCFGCNSCFKLIGLVEMLSGCKHSKAIEFIKSVYNVKQQKSEWVLEQQEILRQNALYLDIVDFKLQFPMIYKEIRHRKHHLQLIMLYFSTMINENIQKDGKPVFFGSYEKLMEICNYKDATKFSKSLTMFALLRLITKMDVDDIPEKELKKAKSLAAKYNLTKLTGFYQFEEFGCVQLRSSEKEAKILNDNHITYRGLSREGVLRTFDEARANEVYPQYKYQNKLGTSEKSDKSTHRIATKILTTIEKQGYIKESAIKTSSKVEIQWKRSIFEILNNYGLVRVRASEDIKKLYGIPKAVSYQSFVIVRQQ